MIHSFSVELAVKFGEKQAIILNNLAFWQKKNQENCYNFNDGYYWVYNSVKAFQGLFPYWSLKQIRNILDKLEELKLVKSGNYNKDTRNRTKWYTIIEPCILQFYQLQLPKTANEVAQNGKSSITLIDNAFIDNTLPQKRKTEYSQEFLDWFNSYPKQKDTTKTEAFKWWQRKTKSEKDNIILATKTYSSIIQKERTKNQFIIAARNFIGRDERYLNYLEIALKQNEAEDEQELKNMVERKYYNDIQFDLRNGMSKEQSLSYYIKKEKVI